MTLPLNTAKLDYLLISKLKSFSNWIDVASQNFFSFLKRFYEQRKVFTDKSYARTSAYEAFV